MHINENLITTYIYKCTLSTMTQHSPKHINYIAIIYPAWDTCFWNQSPQLHQPRLWFITGGYLVKRWFLPAAARARGQSNDLNRGTLASNLFKCRKEVINAPPVPSVSRCIDIVYRHKNIWEFQWSNFIYNCMSTFLHYVPCKDALLDRSAPGGERCESLTGVDEISIMFTASFRAMLEYLQIKMTLRWT